MISFIDLLVVVGMFLLRFGAPLLVVVGIGYLLKRLDVRWEAEARAGRTAEVTEQPAQRPSVPQPAERPATSKRIPAPTPMPQQPFIIPPAVARDSATQVAQPGLMAQLPGQRVNCAAPQKPGMPCWQTRFDAEGKIPEDCVKCDIFQRYPLM